jgi:hypothetical protein
VAWGPPVLRTSANRLPSTAPCFFPPLSSRFSRKMSRVPQISRIKNRKSKCVKMTRLREKIFDSGHFATRIPPTFDFPPGKAMICAGLKPSNSVAWIWLGKISLIERSFGAQNSRCGLAREVRWGPSWKNSVQRSSPKLPLCHNQCLGYRRVSGKPSD